MRMLVSAGSTDAKHSTAPVSVRAGLNGHENGLKSDSEPFARRAELTFSMWLVIRLLKTLTPPRKISDSVDRMTMLPCTTRRRFSKPSSKRRVSQKPALRVCTVTMGSRHRGARLTEGELEVVCGTGTAASRRAEYFKKRLAVIRRRLIVVLEELVNIVCNRSWHLRKHCVRRRCCTDV